MKLYMFRTVRLSITRSLFTVHSVVVYKEQSLYRPGMAQLYMFRTVPLSITRSLFTVHSVVVYKGKAVSFTGPEWPRGFQEVKVLRFHDNGT
jgi:hypothetical protein